MQRDLGLRELPLGLLETETGPVLRTVGIAGTLRLGSRQFDIAPKHVVHPEASNWRRALIMMMERVVRRRAEYSVSDRLDLGRGTFADYFAFSFAMALHHALQSEPVRLYTTRRELSPVLRGRLLVAEQLRSSLTRPHVLACEVDRLDPDNPVNRLLHWAGRHLLDIAQDGRVRRFLSHSLGRLPEVSNSGPPVQFRAKLPRQFAHYATAVELAVALARAEGPHPVSRAERGAGFVLGTERLFEQFIERSLASIARRNPWDVKPQLKESFAEPIIANTGRTFFSKPDNVVQTDGVTRLVVDAKYKRFEDATEESRGSRPTNADLYQLASAAVAHRSNKALLVYPKLDLAKPGDSPIRWWRVDGWSTEALHIGVATVDLEILGQRDGIRQFDERLEQRIEEALE